MTLGKKALFPPSASGTGSITQLLLALVLAAAGFAAVLGMASTFDSSPLPIMTASAQATTCPPGPTYPTGFGGDVCVPAGDAAFAQSVVSFVPGAYLLDDAGCIPNNQTATTTGPVGPPDAGMGANGRDVSMGGGGVFVLQFTAPLTGSGDNAPDVFVWETGPVAEGYRVDVSADGQTWTTVGHSDGATQGSQGFDIDHAGFDETSRLYFVRITDTGNLVSGCGGTGVSRAGSDIDAVAVLTAAPFALLDLEKTNEVADGTELAVGDEVTYTFTATNTGNVDLFDVTITDALPGLSAIDPASADIPAGESATFTATYTVTQVDLDNGEILNTATATGDPDPACTECTPPVSPPAETTVIVPQDPALTLVKTADTAGPVALGETITYTFVAENTGNVTLGNITITDVLAGLEWVDGPNLGDLAPGETAEGTATYVVTEADVLAGSVFNSATGTSTPPESCVDCDPTTPPSEVTIITEEPVPGIDLTKSADTGGPAALGETITYTFVATNTGNLTLTDVTIADPLLGLTWVTGPNLGTLAPGETATGTATYTATEADVLNGEVVNSATGTGTPPEGYEGEPPTDTPPPVIIIIEAPEPGLDLTKQADTTQPVGVGDVITYSLVATNTGNVTLDDVTITDDLAGLTWVTGPNLGTLAPGESATGTATYVVTETDLANGSVVNIATGTGGPPPTCEVCTPPIVTPPPVEVPTENPNLTLHKRADTEGPVAVGDTITYTFVAENIGNVPLTDVTITDVMDGLTWVTGPNLGTLEPGQAATGTATYEVTDVDLANGSVYNSATATGGCDDCMFPPTTPPSDVEVPTENPGLSLAKSADTAGPVGVGDIITYTFVAENTGNVPLSNVTVSDGLAGLTWVNGPNLGDLAPGETATGTATYTVTQADLNAGSVYNSATATCDTCGGPTPPSDVEVPTDPLTLGLRLDKAVSPDTTVEVGDTLTYTFVVTNIGSGTVDNVTVIDPLPGISAVDGPQGTSLAPGEQAVFTATYVVTEADTIVGVVANTATASGTGPNAEELTGIDTARVRACFVPGKEAPTPEPTAEPTEVVTDEPTEVPAEEPAETPVDEPVETPADEPIEDPIDEPGDEPIGDDPIDEEPIEDPVDDPIEEPIGDDPADDPIEDPVDEPIEDPVDAPEATEAPVTGRQTIFGFAQVADDELADCEPLPVDPVDPDPTPAPQQPQRPQAPAAPGGGGPVVATLPSTGQAQPSGSGMSSAAMLSLAAAGALALAYTVARGGRMRRR